MDALAVAFGKLAGLSRTVTGWLMRPAARYFDPAEVLECFRAYGRLLEQLKQRLPDLYDDMPVRSLPTPSKTTDYDGRGYIERPDLERLLRDIEYIFEVRSQSKATESTLDEQPRRAFLSHGRSGDWREVQEYVERDLKVPTLELAQQPNMGRTVLQKLDEEAGHCSYAIIVMTGEDQMPDGEMRTRENVIHEIGFFQGRFGLSAVCLLYEEGTNIPSNIHGLVYIPFPKGMVRAAFGPLLRDLRAHFAL